MNLDLSEAISSQTVPGWAQFLETKKLVMWKKQLLTVTELYQGKELIASKCFESQLLNSLQFFYKENMAKYHSLDVLIIGWGAEAEFGL